MGLDPTRSNFVSGRLLEYFRKCEELVENPSRSRATTKLINLAITVIFQQETTRAQDLSKESVVAAGWCTEEQAGQWGICEFRMSGGIVPQEWPEKDSQGRPMMQVPINDPSHKITQYQRCEQHLQSEGECRCE